MRPSELGTAPIQVVQYARELFENGDRHRNIQRRAFEQDIQAPIHRDDALRRLKQHIPGYEKGAGSAFAITCHRLDIATQRANALATRFNAKTDPEPYTAIVDLVTLLISLRG